MINMLSINTEKEILRAETKLEERNQGQEIQKKTRKRKKNSSTKEVSKGEKNQQENED